MRKSLVVESHSRQRTTSISANILLAGDPKRIVEVALGTYFIRNLSDWYVHIFVRKVRFDLY
jgi:hypothetical protein